jgi:type IV secretory pathway VirB3-like protein
MTKSVQELDFEAALKFYELTRNALVARVTLRDNSIMFYIAGIAALAGATVQSQKLIYLMIIPIVSLGVAGIVAHHNKMISGYVLYLSQELQPKFNELGITTVQWDMSHSSLSNKNVGMRYFSDAAYISIPSILAICLNRNAPYHLVPICIGCTILSVIILWHSYNFHLFVDTTQENVIKGKKKTPPTLPPAQPPPQPPC